MAHATPVSVTELRGWLREQIADLCLIEAHEVDVDRPLDEYGLSSRDSVDLATRLEDHLGVNLDATLLWEYPTIGKLAAGLATAPADVPRQAERNGTTTAQTENRVAQGRHEPIAVVGLGCRLPGGVHGPAQFWDLLQRRDCAVRLVEQSRWEQFPGVGTDVLNNTPRYGGFLDDIAGFDAEYFGISPGEAARMDPQQRLLLEVTQEALLHAGIGAERLRGSRTGVFVGISGNEYGQLSLADPADTDVWAGTGSALSIAANRLSYAFDLHGPSTAVDSACSSSLVAVHLAVRSLRDGESDAAIVGGANLVLGPAVTASFDQMGLLSPDGRCKPFAAGADGISRSEGAGVVVLKRLSDALAEGDRVLAVVAGSAVNSDGRSNGLTAPNPQAQQALLRAAYADADIDPVAVDYVEAHGTGTPLGDPIEAHALGAVLGAGRGAEGPLLLGSVKSNLGHLEAAAGVTGLIKTVLALHHRAVPASVNYDGPNPHIDFDALKLAVVTHGRAWPTTGQANVAGVSGFGFGGTNAHIVLRGQNQAERQLPDNVDVPRRVLLGAASDHRLDEFAGLLADWLEQDGAAVPLSAVESTLRRRLTGRRRVAVVGCDRSTVVDGLREVAAGARTAPKEVSHAIVGAVGDIDGDGPDARSTVWVFSGHGSQWPGMGLRLARTEPEFAAALTELEPLVRAECGFSLHAALASGVEHTAMDVVQPLLFAMHIGIARVWTAAGLSPAAVIGNSVGEVAAAVVSGALSLADGVAVVARRSELLSQCSGNSSMAMLEMPAEDVRDLLRGRDDVDIAVYNSPRQTVIAGYRGDVESVVELVQSQGLLATLVKVDVAAHSPVVAPVAHVLGERLPELRSQPPHVRMYRTATDDPRSTVELNAAYWMANFRSAVRFTQAVRAAIDDGLRTFVEISPHPLLGHAISETAEGTDVSVLFSGRRSSEESVQLHGQRALLELSSTMDLSLTESAELTDVPIPPWQHKRHWLTGTQPRTGREHPLLGTHIDVPGGGQQVWETRQGIREFSVEKHPWLRDHPVVPAALYLELALSAAQASFAVDVPALTVAELELHVPLAGGEGATVTTTLTMTGSRSARIAVHSRVGRAPWRFHASAEVLVQATPRPIQLPATEPASWYSIAGESGPDTGRAEFVDRVLATVRTRGRGAPGPCRPVFVGALRFAEGVGDNGSFGDARRMRVQLCDDEECSRKHGSVHVVDPQGRVLVELQDVALSDVDPQSEPVPLADKLFTAQWQRDEHTRAHHPSVARTAVIAAMDDVRGVHLTVALAERDQQVRSAVLGSPATNAIATAEHVVLVVPAQSAVERSCTAVDAVVDTVRSSTELRSAPPRLWLLTSGAAAIEPGEIVDPTAASMRGLVRVLGHEHPELRTTLVDLPADDKSLAPLLAELDLDADDREVARRGGNRYVARLVRGELTVPPVRGPRSVRPVRPDGAYVVTGGLGGLGLVLAKWLGASGAARIVLNGRREPKPEAWQVIGELRRNGSQVVVVTGDIAEATTARRLVTAATADGMRLRGVIHGAGVLDDKVVLHLDADSVAKVWAPKAIGAWHLHQSTAGLDLDFWIGFSSAAALLGSPGQAAYAAANAYLDGVVQLRAAQGLAATSIQWGTWSSVGLAAHTDLGAVRALDPAEGIEALEALLAAAPVNSGVLKLDPAALGELLPTVRENPYYAPILPTPEHHTEQGGIDELRSLAPAAAEALVRQRVDSVICSVMGLSAHSIDRETALTSMGMDSLLAVRTRNMITHELTLTPPPTLLLGGAGVRTVQDWALERLGLTGTARPVPAAQPEEPAAAEPKIGPRDGAERLVLSVWQRVLGRSVHVTDDFYDLGGGGDDEQRVLELLAEQAPRPLTRAALFEHPTVERMAALVREAEDTSGGVRVLRADGEQRPLLVFHPGGGDTSVYRQLVQHLDPGFPVFGFDRVDSVTSVEDRAEHYLPALRELQPHGPYRLAGWSFGGFLAYELGRRLVELGEHVELVAMIDSIIPLPVPDGVSEVEILRTRFERFGEFLTSSYGRSVDLPFERMALMTQEEQVEQLIRSITSAGVVDRSVSAAILRHQRTSFVDTMALERYTPVHYPAPVHFYSATELPEGGLADPRFDRRDPARGWDVVRGDELTVVAVPGHHLSVLDPPNVAVLAGHLNAVLAARPVSLVGSDTPRPALRPTG